jgi:hypothetical protein
MIDNCAMSPPDVHPEGQIDSFMIPIRAPHNQCMVDLFHLAILKLSIQVAVGAGIASQDNPPLV